MIIMGYEDRFRGMLEINLDDFVPGQGVSCVN